MRMRKSLLKKYQLRKRSVTKNKEGSSVVSYQQGIEVEAVIWSAGGKVQAEMYGERLAYIKNMQYEGAVDIQEGDGICVFVTEEEIPDYKVIAIQPEYQPMQLVLEKIR